MFKARLFVNIVEIRRFIKPTLDWLLSQQFPSGNFPSSLNSSNGDKLVQWCHGAPGFVPLCILAYQVLAVLNCYLHTVNKLIMSFSSFRFLSCVLARGYFINIA